MEQSIHDSIASAFPELRLRDAEQISPAVLAYVGDTVYDLYVRTSLIHAAADGSHKLHLKAAALVNAAAQAAFIRAAESELTPHEAEIYKRGRNGHSGVVPRHALVADYRAATGFEALVGYLYLTGQDGRLTELMRRALAFTEKETEHD